MAHVLERVARREPLVAGGFSGSQLERGWLDDGTAVIIKHADPRHDWLMQGTGDDGRVAELWTEGVFEPLPPSIEHAMLDVQRTADGAVVVMKDVSDSLFASDRALQAAHQRLLDAADGLHGALEHPPRAPLCALRDLFALLSPQMCAPFAAEHDVPRQALQGWARFHDIVPRDVSEVIAGVHADPDRLAGALLEHPCGLVHGDLKMSNLGANDHHVVIIDWGTMMSWAPPAVDYAWYMAVNWTELDRLLDDVRSTDAGADDEALRLALVGALAELGWAKALGATDGGDATRQRERDGLEWWIAEVMNAAPLMR